MSCICIYVNGWQFLIYVEIFFIDFKYCVMQMNISELIFQVVVEVEIFFLVFDVKDNYMVDIFFFGFQFIRLMLCIIL